MKTPALVSLLVGVLLLGASLAGNVWQSRQIRAAHESYDRYVKMTDTQFADIQKSLAKLQVELSEKDAEIQAASVKMALQVSEQEGRNRAIIESQDRLIAAYKSYYDAPQVGGGVVQRTSAVTVSARPAPASTSYTPPAPSTPMMSTEELLKTVSRHAERFFKTQHQQGSGSTLVFDLAVDLDAPREVPGWSGRYEVRGVCSYQYYDSVWGGSFRGNTQHFAATVDTVGGAAKIAGFDLRSGPAM